MPWDHRIEASLEREHRHMNRTSLAILTSIIALIAMVLMLREPKPLAQAGDPIIVFCAASNRAVIEVIRADYEQEFQRSVQVQYGPSQTLLSSVEVSRTGDLFLPADDSYLEIGREKHLIAEKLSLATMHAVVAVPKGNPRGIASLADLLKSDVRLVQANPDAAAIGKLTRATLQTTSQWELLDKATTAYRTTVSDVANDLVVGAADAGIVYDAVLHSYPQLEAVQIAELESAVSAVGIGVITSSKQPAIALHFARFVAAKDRGLRHYAAHGFQVTTGDEWADVPEVSLFAGSMLRPAIEDTITAFEKREGVHVSRVYNGCGILVAQMKAGQHPDAYFACDQEFMTQVTDLFSIPVDVSENELVILVQKGNPQKISDLTDLGRKGLRVGIGHEKQCAMGWLTQNALKEGGVRIEVMENVTVQSPTGDMLVNQLRTGSLDAAIVYLSNAAGAGAELDAIRIQGLECSVATQPFAVSKETRYPQLTARLFERLCSAESRDSFEAEGFRWQVK
jgi:ABC-type molybdate transport system substrate-binding protein